MAPEPKELPQDEGVQETADVQRLIKAGGRNEDPLTTSAGVRRASRLKKQGLDITDPTTARILGLDELPIETDD